MKLPNIITAEVNNMVFSYYDGTARNISRGISIAMTRKEFKEFVKTFNGEIIKPAKVGEYRNVWTGEWERLWGLD